MNEAMEPIVRLYPTQEKCRRVVMLNKAGKPVQCGRRGYVRMDDSVPLCKTCAGFVMKSIDHQLEEHSK